MRRYENKKLDAATGIKPVTHSLLSIWFTKHNKGQAKSLVQHLSLFLVYGTLIKLKLRFKLEPYFN